MEIQLQEGNFGTYTADSAKTILVDFWASWCGPCKMLAPVLEEIQQKKPDLLIGKVNVDEEPALAGRFGITSIPTLLLFDKGELAAQTVGYHTKEQLLAWLETQGV